MDQRTIKLLFALLRSAVRGTKLTEQERDLYSPEQLNELLKISHRHDVAHLLTLALKQNGLISENDEDIEKYTFNAFYRNERLRFEYEKLCAALEKAKIAFIPLKGAVIKNYYPEPWMRTSCDIDVLVKKQDLDNAVSYLTKNLKYVEEERATHDVSLFSPMGNHIELHYDLVEEGRANNAVEVLRSVWENVNLYDESQFKYEMTDPYVYLYHIAHMAKHFENGGCGIRPFIDLWILENLESVDKFARDELLLKSGLLKFANATRVLCNVWMNDNKADETSLKMQEFILKGGVYGSANNRVAIQQKKKGGRIGYVFSRIFVSSSKLKRYYPILEKHRWLMPFMQVRRWFMLFDSSVANMARNEINANRTLEKSKANEMNTFLDDIGLN